MSQINAQTKNKSLVNHLDVMVTIWVLAIGAYAHWYVFPIFMAAGGITFLYLLYYLDKYGFFSQVIHALLKEIDIITFPVINKNQPLFKALINIGLLVLIYVVADWIDLIAIFYLSLALYLVFFYMYLQAQ